MHYLQAILKDKKQEVERLIQLTEGNAQHYLNQILNQEHLTASRRFSNALKSVPFAVIGEVKRRSPSLGGIRDFADPAGLAWAYANGGASSISVLTDANHFGGALIDLLEVSHQVKVPVLRKDFILHPLQMAESVFAGAAAVLLIARILGKDLKRMIGEAERLGLEALVEVHDRDDLDMAIDAGALIIGVNHRNLQTFEIDLNISETLRPRIPRHVIAVAESGIHTPAQAKRMRDLEYDAVLVGEALVRSEDPSGLIRKMKGSTLDLLHN